MVPRRRHARRGRRAVPHTPPATGPSVAELAVYGSLAAVVAAALLIVNGRPWELAAAVVAGTLALIGVVAYASARVRRRSSGSATVSSDADMGASPDETTEEKRAPGRRRRR